ncbi:class I SAM-dependent methyltransferase [Candidatus Dojkabacteria bacterium]|uniref:Class I SAM-dependent methyltransferase n=1 Tax=Candidatus Dojkabacteria bacterium TaxID=2099670 RepID=A0A955L7B7_9BACT|nr:class I SAM-dependent methyltransferase [Candidatus Dojkabacteria bacterium]
MTIVFAKKTLLQILKLVKGNEEVANIKYILQNNALLKFLTEDDKFQELIERASKSRSFDQHIKDIVLYCSDAKLEQINGLAINENGELNVEINEGKVILSPALQNINNEETYQAILRQIERESCLRHQGILKKNSFNNILDVGSGTLIGSAMLRSLNPKSRITALEPGLITKKTEKIAKNLKIELIRKELNRKQTDLQEKFDLILLHFVLEHCELEQIQTILDECINLLSEDGLISIIVPNYEAFHRKFESLIGAGGRNNDTRISKEDILIGHQHIFNKSELTEIIQSSSNFNNRNLKVTSQTILPRPISFKNFCKIEKYKELAMLDHYGHPEKLEDCGSVISLLVGKSPRQVHAKSCKSGKSDQIMFRLIEEFLTHKEVASY